MMSILYPLIWWSAVFVLITLVVFVIQRDAKRSAITEFNVKRWMIMHNFRSRIVSFYLVGAVIVTLVSAIVHDTRAKPTEPTPQRTDFSTEKSAIIRKDIATTPQDTGVQPVTSYKQELQELRERQ